MCQISTKSDFSLAKWSFGWKTLKTKNHFTIIGNKWEQGDSTDENCALRNRRGETGRT